MESKEKFLKILHKRLDQSERQLFTLISVETRKEGLIFRMPAGFVSLGSIWEKALEVSAETKVKVSQAGLFATLEELDEILGEIQWLWEGWIARGFVTMIAGDPGVGKSAVAQYIVKVITEGKTFPLQSEPFGKPANVIWVDTEAAQQILKVRADSMQMRKERVFIPVINGDLLSQANLGVSQDREQIVSVIEGTNPDLLVLDSLGGSHTRGENKVEDIRPVMQFLAMLARDYQIGVLVVHHLNKERKDELAEVSLSRIRGSTAITGYCRSIFAVEPFVENSIKLRVIKNNLALIGEPILAKPLLTPEKNLMGFTFSPYQAPPSKKNRKELCADWVLEILEPLPEGIDLKELIEQGAQKGYSRSNIYATREILGDRVVYSGTGNHSHWNLARADTSTVKKILSSQNGKEKKKRKT
jgi:KaiC/GvpD/RAD55 family RecA-like ATPase